MRKMPIFCYFLFLFLLIGGSYVIRKSWRSQRVQMVHVLPIVFDDFQAM